MNQRQPKGDRPSLLKKVNRLPPAIRRKREPSYQHLIDLILEEPSGVYQINLPHKKANTIITALNRQLKQRNVEGRIIKLSKRKDLVYVIVETSEKGSKLIIQHEKER